jgi:hypothetical protein
LRISLKDGLIRPLPVLERRIPSRADPGEGADMVGECGQRRAGVEYGLRPGADKIPAAVTCRVLGVSTQAVYK